MKRGGRRQGFMQTNCYSFVWVQIVTNFIGGIICCVWTQKTITLPILVWRWQSVMKSIGVIVCRDWNQQNRHSWIRICDTLSKYWGVQVGCNLKNHCAKILRYTVCWFSSSFVLEGYVRKILFSFNLKKLAFKCNGCVKWSLMVLKLYR